MSQNEKRTPKTITLGSGKIFIDEYKGEIPEDAEIEKEEKRLGYIKGGATVEYSQEIYTTQDDLGQVKKTLLTAEDVKLKSGIMTWNGNTLKKLISTGRITEEGSKRILKIGGMENYDNTAYVLRFLHEDKVDGNVRVTIIGRNTAGVSLAFTKENETTVDTEFSAEPLDDKGTLLIMEEEITPAG